MVCRIFQPSEVDVVAPPPCSSPQLKGTHPFLLHSAQSLFVGWLQTTCAYVQCSLLVPTQALPLILLYRQERTQYDITVQKLPGKSPSEIYGAEHLLRVFGESAFGGACCAGKYKKIALILQCGGGSWYV